MMVETDGVINLMVSLITLVSVDAGYCLKRKKDYEGATERFEKSIAVRPTWNAYFRE